ncbi:MAG: cadherin-like beta sandwich domain-containing protein [Clostridium sp.]|nr:cadherin-like beta sandwich domain-containing protein [Clostridium sp.]
MKKIAKKILCFVIILLLCIHVPVFDVEAADVNVSIALSASTINVGDTVTATISVSGSNISAYTIYVSYSSGILSYSSGSGMVSGGGGTATISGTGAGSVSITFTAISSGTASISTYGEDAWSIEAAPLSISHAGVHVTVVSPSTTEAPATTEAPENTTGAATESTTEAVTEEEDDEKCYLKSLSISPGTLEPAFSSRTTSYFVQVEEDVTAIDVNAVAEYSTSRVSVSGASSISQGENYITITVTSENGAAKNYYIRVMAGKEKGDPVVTINGKKLDFVLDKEIEEIPTGFRAVDETYEEWDIVAFQSPNKKLLLVCLADEDEKRSLYIYDKERNIFTLYKEYLAGENRYVILAWREDIAIPEGCEEAQLRIDGELIQAYKLDGDFYLLYAMNIEGDEGIYLYDYKEKTFMRYLEPAEKQETATKTEATPVDATASDITDKKTEHEGFFTRQMLIYYLIGAAVLILIFLITILCLLTKNRRLRKKTALDESLENLEVEGIEAETTETEVSKQENDVVETAKLEIPKIEAVVETEQAEQNAGKQAEAEEINFVDKANEKNIEENADRNEKKELSEEKEEIIEKKVEVDEKNEEKNELKKENSDSRKSMEENAEHIINPDNQAENYAEYEKQSEEIRNKIKVSYNANMDSAFDVDE